MAISSFQWNQRSAVARAPRNLGIRHVGTSHARFSDTRRVEPSAWILLYEQL